MGLHVVVDFEVIDESDDWLVVNKPAPLIVHPANRKPEPTLLGGVEHLLAFEIENGACPAIVNRLDRDTSGLVLIAKHTRAARELGMIFERREVEKEYLAIVVGWPGDDGWTVDAPIARAGDFGVSSIWVRQIIHPQGRASRTSFCVEHRFERPEGKFALIRCFPETGRMHQLRVHLAHSGHPIVGDKIYVGDGTEYIEWMETGWTPALASRLHLPRHALHAAGLKLENHPSWRAQLASDMAAFLRGETVVSNPDAIIWSRHGD